MLSLIAIGLSGVVLNTISSIDIGFWGGIVVYGLLNMLFGASEVFGSSSSSGSSEILNLEVDSLIVPQILTIVFAISTVIWGRILKQWAQSVIGTISQLQILGIIVLLTRLVLVAESKSSLFHGKWSHSIYSLGIALVFLSPFIPMLPVSGSLRQIPRLALPLFIAMVVFLSRHHRLTV